jgi:hypothetical protein
MQIDSRCLRRRSLPPTSPLFCGDSSARLNSKNWSDPTATIRLPTTMPNRSDRELAITAVTTGKLATFLVARAEGCVRETALLMDRFDFYAVICCFCISPAGFDNCSIAGARWGGSTIAPRPKSPLLELSLSSWRS